MEFLSDYGLFLAKVLTVVFAVVFITGALTQMRKGDQEPEGELKITKPGDRLRAQRNKLASALMDKKALKEQQKAWKKAEKSADTKDKPRTFVLDFRGDMQAKAAQTLREEISALLTQATEKDEVLVRLESAGGVVHGYGLAASQLDRIRKKGIRLTVAIDKVAASGGYMMACVADHIIAAPFAILGSIGVIGQVPNIHRLLEKHDVDIEMHTAGEYKRTLTVLGKNTEKDREKFIQDLENTHQLFKAFVSEHRPKLDIESVATGEIWFGREALDKKLVDEVMTSDEYLAGKIDQGPVVQLRYIEKKKLQQKIAQGVALTLDSAVDKLDDRIRSSNFLS